MKKRISPLKWFLGFIATTLTLCIGLASITYFFDPACYYSIPKNSLIVNNFKFVNAGLIKNAEYDSVILGSSVSQNFNVDLIREKLDINPVKITGGGVSVFTMEIMYEAIKNEGRAKTVICDINLAPLNSTEDIAYKSYPFYIYDENKLNDIKYLLGYEPLMKLIPFNIDYNIREKKGEHIPDVHATHNIDLIGNWDETAEYGNFTKSDYTRGMTAQNLDGINERMQKNADFFMDYLLTDCEDTDFIIFFPPYSGLLWYDARVCGHFDQFLNTKAHLIRELEKFPNVKVFDFQTMPEINDLDNYKDNVHYSAKINDMLVEYFATGEYLATSETIDENVDKLNLLVDEFSEKYADILAD